MKFVLLALGCGAIALTALSCMRSAQWWIRAVDFPRLQIAVALAAVAAAYAFLFDPTSPLDGVFGLALLGSLGYQCARILPYTPLTPRQVADASSGGRSRTVRILVCNVLMDNRRAADFLALVRAHDPDLILVMETDAWWDERLRTLDADYPNTVRRPQENEYGMHFFSRLRLGAAEVRTLVEDDVPSVRAEVHLRSGDVFVFNGIHPRPPRPSQDTEERDAELLIVGREVKADGRPGIIAGDLNDVAWSHTTRLFQRISGMLDPRRGRGMFSTFHAGYPMLRWPLDHVFHDPSFTLVHLRRLRHIGSDHFPVLVELKFEPRARAMQAAPRADGEDRTEARQRVAATD